MDISHGELVERELDALITRRHAQRRESEPERQERELWQVSEEAAERQRREANRISWIQYHRDQITRLQNNAAFLIARHEREIKKLERMKAA